METQAAERSPAGSLLTIAQQAAVDAATKAGGHFISYELLESKEWREQVVRGSQYFQDVKDEWISQWFQRSILDIPETLYKELEQQLVDSEVEELLNEKGLLLSYLPRAKPTTGAPSRRLGAVETTST